MLKKRYLSKLYKSIIYKIFKLFYGEIYSITKSNDSSDIKEKRSRNIPTIPTILSEEKKLNPFLKFDNKSYLDSIGMDFISSSKNFGRIRKLKDNF